MAWKVQTRNPARRVFHFREQSTNICLAERRNRASLSHIIEGADVERKSDVAESRNVSFRRPRWKRVKGTVVRVWIFTCWIPGFYSRWHRGNVIAERTEKSMRVASVFGSPERTSRRIFSPRDTRTLFPSRQILSLCIYFV